VRRFPLLCAALVPALLLAACGGDGGGGVTAASAGAAGGTRTVEHAMGTTRITGLPKRVVVLDTGELDSAVALGVKPVGAVEAIAGDGLPAYLGDAVEGIKLVGTIEQPNLETIAALRPDLILSSKVRHEAVYDQLARIAPTVFSEDVGVTWKANFALDARALGRTAQAKRLQADYDRKAVQLRTALGRQRAERSVSVVRSVGDEVRIYLEGNFLGTILKDVGLPRPRSQAKPGFSETATPERIPDLDADLMILSRYGDDHRLLRRLQANRLWSRLGVVRADRVFEVPDDLWFLGIGNFAARKVLDDLRRVVLDGQRLPGDDGNPQTA
jgi:iron complex transport system substrate-binding protein